MEVTEELKRNEIRKDVEQEHHHEEFLKKHAAILSDFLIWKYPDVFYQEDEYLA